MKKLTVKMKPNNRENKVVQTGARDFEVITSAAARDGEANRALLNQLADYLNINKSRLVILKGEKQRNKIVGLLDD